MYMNRPAMIPDVRGKISYKKYGETRYVQYETGRRYDPDRKYNLPERVIIGVQIPGRPEMMLPNENYLVFFGKEGTEMDEEKEAAARDYAAERERRYMLRDFFEQLYFEFQMMSRRNGNAVMNEDKVKRLNRVLGPLREMMAGEEYAVFLELIPEPESTETEDGRTVMKGMTYSDAALLMTQFKGAVNRFFQKRM